LSVRRQEVTDASHNVTAGTAVSVHDTTALAKSAGSQRQHAASRIPAAYHAVTDASRHAAAANTQITGRLQPHTPHHIEAGHATHSRPLRRVIAEQITPNRVFFSWPHCCIFQW